MKTIILNTILASVLLLTFCSKIPEYSNIPYIEFRSVTVNRVGTYPTHIDCTFVKIFFRDGDGNLGLNVNKNAIDSLNNIKCDSTNYSLDMYIKLNHKFVRVVYPDPKFNYQKNTFKRLSDSDTKRPLQGEITFRGVGINLPLDGAPQTTPPFIGNDTIKFAIQIKDRDCNASNIVESTEVVVNKPD